MTLYTCLRALDLFRLMHPLAYWMILFCLFVMVCYGWYLFGRFEVSGFPITITFARMRRAVMIRFRHVVFMGQVETDKHAVMLHLALQVY